MSRYIDAEKIKYTEYINGDVTVSKDLVEKIPTADVQEVRYGEWIESDYGICHCSECGFEYKSQAEVTQYCPGCGARMDGGESDES